MTSKIETIPSIIASKTPKSTSKNPSPLATTGAATAARDRAKTPTAIALKPANTIYTMEPNSAKAHNELRTLILNGFLSLAVMSYFSEMQNYNYVEQGAVCDILVEMVLTIELNVPVFLSDFIPFCCKIRIRAHFLSSGLVGVGRWSRELLMEGSMA